MLSLVTQMIDLKEIESLLDDCDPQARMKAIVELRHYQPETVVPLLKRRMHDKEFMIRSFVAMGLGRKRTDEGFNLLLDIIAHDQDSNVVAEAANSLAEYGPKAIPHLVNLFEQSSHWLVRQSILAAIEGKAHPEALFKLCQLGYEDPDLCVKRSALSYLGELRQTEQATAALETLLNAAVDPVTIARIQAARTLSQFDDPRAAAALSELQHDPDHRVVGAVLERLM